MIGGWPRTARVAGAFATIALAASFWLVGGAAPLASFYAASLLVLLPVMAYAQRRPDAADLRASRVLAYATSSASLAAMALLAGWLAQDLRGGGGLRLVRPESLGDMAWMTAVLVLVSLVVAWEFKDLFGCRETEIVRALIPATWRERGAFVLLSLTAGVCEEIVFRGFLPAFLLPWLGSYLLAALPAAAAFGVLHAYQGIHGMARTAIMGMVFAVGVAWSGSLWPAIAAHVLVNLLFGLALNRYFFGAPAARLEQEFLGRRSRTDR